MEPIINPIAGVLGQILEYINGVVHSYGLSIILLTLLIKIVLLPTGINQQKYTDKMKVLQPKIKELQAKFKDKPEELQRRQMALYKEVGVNPLGGCLPLLLQLPIFFALFSLLRDPAKFNVPMQGAQFLGLVLSEFVTKQGAVAVIVMFAVSALTTYWQQAMVMTDSSQKAMMYMMPLFFGYISVTVPAGLAVYWVSNNVFSIIQQYGLSYYLRLKARGGKPANEDSGEVGKDG